MSRITAIILLFIVIPLYGQETGTFIDERDSHQYKWVKIGEQVWMSENLAYLPSINNPKEGNETNPKYYVFYYDGSNVAAAKSSAYYKTYGVLYNWEAALIGCPNNWHLPTDEEWKTLERFLGMSESDVNRLISRKSGNVGMQLKQNRDWNSDSSIEESGFNAIPCGIRDISETFFGQYKNCQFWSSTPFAELTAFSRGLLDITDGINRFFSSRGYGYSVRCIRNN
jgi:uncharacterized protein (TIGR02145 family)